MLETERLILLPVTMADAQYIGDIRNEEAVRRGLFSCDFCTQEGQEEWFNSRHDRVDFMMRIKPGGPEIGTVNLTSIDHRNQRAEFGIIVAPEYQGRGYGYEATVRLLGYAFDELNLHRIYLHVLAGNGQAVKLYQRLGFQIEGCLRQDAWKEGSFHNVLVMAILRGEAIRGGNIIV